VSTSEEDCGDATGWKVGLLRDERGFTLIEMLVAMTILLTVVTALASLFTSGSQAEASLNLRFRAQAQARVALDTFRQEVHNACQATVSGGGTTVQLLKLTTSYLCSNVSSTWCTVGSGSRYALYRKAGSSCDATGVQWADYITTTAGQIFSLPTAVSGLLPKVSVDIIVNWQPTTTRLAYELKDSIVLRNGVRA
jgi:prepilin-type N-terminal cleavage/methylation domain-containing protein